MASSDELLDDGDPRADVATRVAPDEEEPSHARTVAAFPRPIANGSAGGGTGKDNGMDIGAIGRVLVGLGLLLALVGGVLIAGAALGLGRLPGDLTFGNERVRVVLPLATCIVLSVVATVIANLVMRR